MTAITESTTAEAQPAGAGSAKHDVSARARGPRLSTIFTLVFVGAGMQIGLQRLNDNSFMWHLRTGHWILDNGAVPRGDIYSFTEPGTKWIAQSWLAEVVYGVIDEAAGPFGLRLFGALVGGVVGGLLFWIGYRASRNRLRGALVAAAAFVTMLNVWGERPLMLGIIAMMVLVIVVELPETSIGKHPYIALPILMWLWVNVHGTFMLGFLYLGLHLVGRLAEGHSWSRGRERDLLRASALAGIVMLANPYFLDLVLFPVRLMSRSEVLANVDEWQSPNFRETGAQFFGLFVVMTIVVLARKHAGRRDLLVSVAFVCLGLYAIRNVGITAVVCLPIVARLLGTDKESGDDRRSFHRLIVAGAVAVLALLVVNAAAQPDWDTSTYPIEAWQNARQVQHLQGRRLLTTDAWAGYIILRSYPDQKVFFDDRFDMYSVELNAAYSDIISLAPKWDEHIDKYDIDVVMWPRDSALSQILAERDDWKRTYIDKVAVIYVRDDT